MNCSRIKSRKRLDNFIIDNCMNGMLLYKLFVFYSDIQSPEIDFRSGITLLLTNLKEIDICLASFLTQIQSIPPDTHKPNNFDIVVLTF